MNYDNTRNKERNSCDIHATLQPRFTQNVTTFGKNNIHIHNLQKISFPIMYLFAVWLLGWLNFKKNDAWPLAYNLSNMLWVIRQTQFNVA